MRTTLLAAAAVAAIACPGAVMAQSGTTSGEPPSASDMKGPPNAQGFGKDTGLAKGSTVVGGEGSSETPSAKDMKGSPNADGYGK